jgi:hypothetical protein
MYIGLHVKYQSLSDFNVKNFLDRFSKNILISKFMELLLQGAELFHTDGRTGEQT